MRVDGLEVETAGYQEDDRHDGGDASEAACTPLGGLEQTVDGLQEAVGLARLRPGQRVCRILCKRTIHRRRKPACP